MFLADKEAADERGSIMILVLMMFCLISYLAVTTLETGVMEFKSSHYDLAAQQAQQAVDAGVDWGLEIIWEELSEPANLMAENLPASLICSNQTMYLDLDGKTCEVHVGEVVNQINLLNSDSCTYEFISTGIFAGACQKAIVQATYYFTGGYQSIEPDGSISFVPRQYLNRGEITYYQTSI